MTEGETLFPSRGKRLEPFVCCLLWRLGGWANWQKIVELARSSYSDSEVRNALDHLVAKGAAETRAGSDGYEWRTPREWDPAARHGKVCE